MTLQEDFTSLPVAKLFSLMYHNVEDTTTSRRAYNEFKRRYSKSFWNMCKEVCKKNNFYSIRDLDKEVYRTSMQEIYINANSFEESKRTISKSLEDQLILGWLGKIAETVIENIISENKQFGKFHLLIPDYHEHLADLKSYQQSNDEIEDEEKNKDKSEDLQRRRIMIFEKGMMKLKPRERDILLEYFKPKGSRKYLSEERITYLCAKWGISLDNLLQIKHRAFPKLKRFCEDEEKKADNKGY